MTEQSYGFTYKGRHCSEFGARLLRYNVGSPQLRENEDTVAGLDGVIDYGTELGKREITVTIDLLPDGRSVKRRQSEIYGWLNPLGSYGELSFSDVPERHYNAKLTGTLSIEQIADYGEFTITFKCADPAGYEPADTYDKTLYYDTDVDYDEGDMYPNPSGMSWKYVEQALTLHNYSAFDTPVVITITGTVGGGEIEHTPSGRKLKLPNIDGQQIVIDSGKETLRVDGISALSVDTGDFFTLSAGDNALMFRAETVDAKVSVDWAHKFY